MIRNEKHLLGLRRFTPTILIRYNIVDIIGMSNQHANDSGERELLELAEYHE